MKYLPWALLALVAGTSSCVTNGVRFTARGPDRYYTLREKPATTIDGHSNGAQEIINRLKRPNATLVELYRDSDELRRLFSDQLGSPDYEIVGHVEGHGNRHARTSQMLNEMRKRAAEGGGDVILLTDVWMTKNTYLQTTGGGSYTYGSAQGTYNSRTTGNYGGGYYSANTTGNVSATGQSTTVQFPTKTQMVTDYFPNAQGEVLRLIPGSGKVWETITSLPEGALREFEQAREDYFESAPAPRFVEWAVIRAPLLDRLMREHGGNRPPPPTTDVQEKDLYTELQKLRALLDEGTITQGEFDMLKARLLADDE